MKIVIQVVDHASVSVLSKRINEIKKGYLLLIGIDKEDNETIVQKMAKKIYELRINKDENDKTNLSIQDVDGEILSISQFTLCANLESRRPSFAHAADAKTAKNLYELFNKELKSYGIIVKEGVFGAEMEICLTNHGPFTIVLTEKDIEKRK